MKQALIIDDSETEIHKLRSILEKNGFSVHCATGGISGVELAQKIQPDFILMDIVMPDLNGFQATRQLAKGKDTSHIPVIVITTKDQPADRAWAERQGAKAYLVKPVGEKLLIDTIKQVLVNQ